MTSSSLGGYGSTYSSQAAQAAALYAEMFSLKCDAGFFVMGLQEGEAVCTPIRVISTLITMSVASAWFSRRKSIKRLLLFFSHWLSGLLHLLIFMAESTMISVCWAGDSLTKLIKTLKFFELAASNMLAITNLAICVNLALIVMSHRTLSRVSSVSTPRLILLFLALSLGAAATSVPFWTDTVVSGTGFWMRTEEEVAHEWIVVSGFFIEFFVGVCMLVIVVWLLIFRRTEIKECWKMHARIRYYFGLTLIATAVNLALGVCGTIYVVGDMKEQLLPVITWAFRYVHVALDTIVLYGVLGTRSIDERATSLRSGASVSEGSSRRARSSGHAAAAATSNRSGGALQNTSGLSKRSSSSNPGLFSSGPSKTRVRDRFETPPTAKPPSHWG